MSGLFLREGTSDEPLAEVIEQLFARRGVALRLTSPDLARLPATSSTTVQSKIVTGLALSDGGVDLLVVHRDADAAGSDARLTEIRDATRGAGFAGRVLPVVPVRMTESWLLLDEEAIRRVAGNPTGRTELLLPSLREAERLADPKTLLRDLLVTAADVQGRRRREAARRFSAHRRRLLSELDIDGPVGRLVSFRALETAVAEACAALT